MDQAVVVPIAFAILAVVFSAIELARPARPFVYSFVPSDIAAATLYQVVIFPLAALATDSVGQRVSFFPDALTEWPLVVRLVAFYLLADFGSYWMHRGLHTRVGWRAHKWHHAPTQIYWLAGLRATLPQQIIFNLPYVLALPILRGAPSVVFVAIAIEGLFRNNWMHMNVTWRSSWLEWVFVTPRFHHLHHSDDRERHDGNFGSLFSLWDRLFGTFVDPDKNTPATFGLGEKTNPVRLILGV